MKTTTELTFLTDLPSPQKLGKHLILIYDRELLQFPRIKTWLQRFPFAIPVQAGEKLKTIKEFERKLTEVLKFSETLKTKDLTLVAVGGGSVGDFVGFIASVFKRGVPLIQIPSTWLAAIDSAHGGKTALNAGGYKNQVGTFYPAQSVVLCRPLLFTQPPERVQEAMGEVLKTGLLQGRKLWSTMSQEVHFDSACLWHYLPQLIQYKYKIVNKDPFETKGLRYFLNFGHSYGHAIESTQGLPHGVAVNLGLILALEFSVAKGFLTPKKLQKIISTPLMAHYGASLATVLKALGKMPDLERYLGQDKKISKNGKINFVFLQGPGGPVVKETPVSELLDFAKRLGQ